MITVRGTGNLSSDPEKDTVGENNTPVVRFRMRLTAYARRKKDEADWDSLSAQERQDDMRDRDHGMWVRVSCFNPSMIDAIHLLLKTGDPVFIEGDFQRRPFINGDNRPDVSYDINADLVLPWLPKIQTVHFKRASTDSTGDNPSDQNEHV